MTSDARSVPSASAIFPSAGRFAQLLETAIADPAITGEQFRLLARIERYQGAGDNAFPAVATLAYDLGRDEATVRADLTVLVLAGWLERVRRPGVTSLYRVTAPDENDVRARFDSARSARQAAAAPARAKAKARKKAYEKRGGTGSDARTADVEQDEVWASDPVPVRASGPGGMGLHVRRGTGASTR